MIKLLKRLRSWSVKQQPYWAFKNQLQASDHFQMNLSVLTIPVEIFYGSKDKFISGAGLSAMKAELPHAKIVEFSGNHYFFLLQTEKFTKEIIEFLKTREKMTKIEKDNHDTNN